MEKVLFIDNRYYSDIYNKDIFEPYDRIYLGNEFCDIQLPTEQQLNQIRTASSLPITLIFPILSEISFKNATDCIDFAIRSNIGVDEIVFNDWGLYHFLNSKNIALKLVAGRMISKNKRDPRISDFDLNILLTEEGMKALAAPIQEHYIEYYKKFNIDRIEIDITCASLMRDVNDVSITIWDTWNILAVGRICPFVNNWKSYRVATVCNKECKNKSFFYTLNNKNQSSIVMQYGNAILYKSSKSIPPNCDRVVFFALCLENDISK